MKAGELLDIFQTRLNMQVEGVTNPSDNIKEVMKTLVEKLSNVDSNEIIDVVVLDKEKHHTQYIF